MAKLGPTSSAHCAAVCRDTFYCTCTWRSSSRVRDAYVNNLNRSTLSTIRESPSRGRFLCTTVIRRGTDAVRMRTSLVSCHATLPLASPITS